MKTSGVWLFEEANWILLSSTVHMISETHPTTTMFTTSGPARLSPIKVLASAISVLVTTLTSLSGQAVGAHSHLLSSTSKFQGFAELDLAIGLGKYIQHETKRLEIIKHSKGYEEEVPIVKERLNILQRLNLDLNTHKAEKERLWKTITDYHPTSSLRLVSQFLQDWDDKLHNHTAYGFRFAEFLSNNDDSRLPNKTDLKVVATAVAEIQFVYNLSTADLYAGVVMGYEGSGLRPREAYEIGVVSMELRHLKQAASWFQAALNHTPEEEMGIAGAKKASYPMADTLARLGVLKYGMDEKGEGLKLLEKATELAPDDEDIRRQFLSRRFGRDVQPLVHSQLDPISVHWFRLCANATSVVKVPSVKGVQNHVCRYRKSTLAPYKVYREEVLSRSPFLSLIYNFINATEAGAVVNASGSKLTDSPVDGVENLLYLVQGTQLTKKVRISSVISSRIADLTGLALTETAGTRYVDEWDTPPPSSAEPLHVLNYGTSGSFLPHYDFGREYGTKHPMRHSGHRMATVLIYLSSVKAGGATAFPHLNVTVTPVVGNALLWYNTSPSGDGEAKLLHAGCPVAVGAKWVASKGIWSYGNEFRHPCAAKVTSSHLAVDKVVRQRNVGR